MKVLVVDCPGILPLETGSGTRVIRWSLIAGLRSRECEVGFVLFDAKADRPDHVAMAHRSRKLLDDLGCRFWHFARASFEQNRQRIVAISREYRSDAILLYGPEGVELTDSLAGDTIRLVMSVDLDHLPDLYRAVDTIRYGSWNRRLRTLALMPLLLLRAWRYRARLLRSFARTDLIVNHAANHACWLQRKLGKPCLYVPNPVSPLAEESYDDNERFLVRPPRFILVGGLGGIATLSGLHFFGQGILPHASRHLAKGDFAIHLIGRGDVDSRLEVALRRNGVVKRGFVEELEGEYASAWAMIVPTPIKLGFRTRILEAFRHGVCVIAHRANAAGFPELEDGKNCLLAGTGREFVAQMLRLASDGDLRRRLSRQAYDDFHAELSADVGVEKMLDALRERITAQSAAAQRA